MESAREFGNLTCGELTKVLRSLPSRFAHSILGSARFQSDQKTLLKLKMFVRNSKKLKFKFTFERDQQQFHEDSPNHGSPKPISMWNCLSSQLQLCPFLNRSSKFVSRPNQLRCPPVIWYRCWWKFSCRFRRISSLRLLSRKCRSNRRDLQRNLCQFQSPYGKFQL